MVKTINQGALMTVVAGVKTLARVAALSPEYRQKLFHILMRYLKTCLQRDVPMHDESILCAVDEEHRNEFSSGLDVRRAEMSKPQKTRLKRLLKRLES